MADHNDPNSVNSIFSDIDVSAADLYDLFGYPADDENDGEKVVIALTFASVPEAGVLDTDILYRIQIVAHPRVPRRDDAWSLGTILRSLTTLSETYFGNYHASDLRVAVDPDGIAHLSFKGFVGGTFSADLAVDQVHELGGPKGDRIKVFVGGRDDAFFNDLPGFFRSINYAPQFYHVPHTRPDLRELPIPKTLIELEGNDLFNYDPANPRHGRGVKLNLPPGPFTWNGNSFAKDADGNFRFVYSGDDAQAGKNVNAIILEVPVRFITGAPDKDRIVNVWAESWVLKASAKVDALPDRSFWREHVWSFIDNCHGDELFHRYKVVDTVGQPFADAGLNEREDARQVGANNHHLGLHFVRRLGHLGWGFGPSITALGLQTSFDHDNAPVSVHRSYRSAISAFPRTKRVVFQSLSMPDDSWNKRGLDIPLRRAYEIFIPNVCAIDMDTTGTWPFGRRPEDQVATRFLALFLDMHAQLNGKPYHLDLLNDQPMWDGAPIVPKTPPNPLQNDKEFLAQFPYLADPW